MSLVERQATKPTILGGPCEAQEGRPLGEWRRNKDRPLSRGSRKSAITSRMADVTHILSKIGKGDPTAADQLLPLVYDELQKLAAARMHQEKAGHTLQATALVHEAYLRLVGNDESQHWDSRGHFFAAAAEAMRRILIESARRKNRIKHGGEQERVDANLADIAVCVDTGELLGVHSALDDLEATDAEAAQLVKLYYFTGMTIDEAAAALGISSRTAYRDWAFARAWLRRRLSDDSGAEAAKQNN